MAIEFEAWPKTTRLFRQITVTEKIDGTNACIIFEPCTERLVPGGVECGCYGYIFAAQSRNRLITPDSDNAGFAQFVYAKHEELFVQLGYGRHYGEWWGEKIGRKYDMTHRVFSIFNTDLWSAQVGDKISHVIGDAELTHVPVLYRGQFDQDEIMRAAIDLRHAGSVAAPGFMSPEGLCIWHSQTRMVQKFTFDNNDKGKWETL
jgi:hypothetical protein